MNPYLVLGVPPGADDPTIRQAYLAAIKESPPDADPQRFQAISQAYEKIKDSARRHQHLLFNRESPAGSPLEVMLRFAAQRRKLDPLPFEAMKEFLKTAAKGGAR
jgi:curved DNA-binding protein CbpA